MTELKKLEEKFETTEKVEEKVDILNKLAWKIKTSDIKRAVDLCQKSIELSESVNYLKGLALGLRNLGWLKIMLADYDEALVLLMKSLRYSEEMEDLEGKAASFNRIATIYSRLGDLSNALEYHLRSLQLFEKTGNKLAIADILGNIGLDYLDFRNYDRALEYFNRSLEIRERIGNHRARANSLLNVGYVYLKMGEYEKALEYELQSLELCESDNDKNGASICLTNLGEIYRNLGEFEKSLEYFEESLKIKKEMENIRGQIYSLKGIGEVYFEQDKMDRALSYWQEALDLAKEIKAQILIYELYELMAESYRKKGDFEKAFGYYKEFHETKEEIFNENVDNKIKRIELDYLKEKSRQEANLKALIENIEGAVFSIDTDFTLLTVNSNFKEFARKFLGAEFEIGGSVLDKLSREFGEECLKNCRRALKGEEFSIEKGFETDDETKFFEFFFNPIITEAGEINGVTVFAKDETERRQKESLYHQMFAKHKVVKLLIDPEDGGIVDANRMAGRFYGYNLDKLKSMKIQDINILPEEEVKRKMKLSLLEKESHFYFEHRLASGEIRNVEVQSVPIDFGDKKLLFSIIYDVTERVEAKKALEKERRSLAQKVRERTAELRRANEKLERASELKDQFLASMSHELRTPLNAVLGLSEALQDEVYGKLNQKQFESVQTIEESGQHLLILINDILDLSKISAGKFDMDISPVYLQNVCKSSLQFIEQLAKKKNLEVLFDFQSKTEYIQSDERRLKQILINLLTNAVKFTPEGKRIGLKVEDETENNIIHFTVWDEGIGISEEDQKDLFQPFVQIDGGLTKKYQGTGLGLSLVSRMVNLHGGTVFVESEVGKGSEFTVTLPVNLFKSSAVKEEEKLPKRKPKRKVETPEKEATILIAEDNEINLIAFSDFISSLGYQVVTARNGKKAVEQAEKHKPDLILMDAQMPIMNGLDAIHKIRENEELQKIYIVMITAMAMPGDKEKFLAAGADDYLSKPAKLKEIRECVEKGLAKL